MFVGNLIFQGGWMILPILLCSIASIAIAMYKWIQFRQIDFYQLAWLNDALDAVKELNSSKLQHIGNKTKHPAPYLLNAMVIAHQEKPHHVEAEAKRIGMLQLQELEYYLPSLAFLAEVAPLLGLLGTVVGMVDMFAGLQNAGQNSIAVADLASGIWKALLTTAGGLLVAVPTLAAHRFFSRKIDHFRVQLNDIVQQSLYHLPSQNTKR